ECGPNLRWVDAVRTLVEAREAALDGSPVVRFEHADEDLRMTRLRRVFGRHAELLEQFLAGANPAVDDLDVRLRDEAGQADEVAREVDDLHGLPHVEDEDL